MMNELPMEDVNELELQKELLAELKELARGGMAREMRQRHGKPLPTDEAPLGEDPEATEPIPGVETSAQTDGEEDLGAEGAEMDPAKLKALLAAMKAQGA